MEHGGLVSLMRGIGAGVYIADIEWLVGWPETEIGLCGANRDTDRWLVQSMEDKYGRMSHSCTSESVYYCLLQEAILDGDRSPESGAVECVTMSDPAISKADSRMPDSVCSNWQTVTRVQWK